jgi:DNA-binding winged helix-turn-helix (wHTH) protein
MEQGTTYLFGPFRLNTYTQLLCTEESCVNLSPKVYRLLLYFLLNSGRLISHEELFDTVMKVNPPLILRLLINGATVFWLRLA